MRPHSIPVCSLLIATLALTGGCNRKSGDGTAKGGSLLDRIFGGRKATASSEAVHQEKGDPGAGVKEMTADEFATLAGARGKLAVAVFHADWCGPCQSLKPVMAGVAAEFPNAVVGRFNVDQCRSLSAEQGVSGIPDVRFFVDGKQVDKFTGLVSADQVREKFKQHSANVTAAPAKADPAKNPAGGPAITPMKKDWLPPGIEKR